MVKYGNLVAILDYYKCLRVDNSVENINILVKFRNSMILCKYNHKNVHKYIKMVKYGILAAILDS